MTTAAPPWHFWMAPALLATGVLGTIALAVAYYRRILVPTVAWRQWRAEQERLAAALAASSEASTAAALETGGERRVVRERSPSRVPVQERVDAILVPLDGSDLARRAVPVAAALASRLDAEIHLFSAVATEALAEERAAELAEIPLPGQAVQRTVTVAADPVDEIHDRYHELGEALICMATHGRGRSAAVVGSVAVGVLARGHPAALVGPLVRESEHSRGIVVCVDGSATSRPLIEVGLRWLELILEPLVVLTVAEPAPDPVREGPVRRAFGPDGDVEATLEELVQPLRDEGHVVETAAVYDPISPAEGVRQYLHDRPATLLVAGSHLRSGLSRLVSGSAAASIVRRSPAPVLVVPRVDRYATR